MTDPLFTDRELDVMTVLWERGPSTVGEVRGSLTDDLAYTTVLTVLRTLEEKGHVGHREEGRAYRYHPRVDRAEARTSHLQRLKRKLFAGSTELMMAHLVSGELSEEEAARLLAFLEERLSDR